MRFRRSIRICKGLRLNFSGSGISMSLGVRGASVTFGKNGLYANYGLPGTGLYNRVKIASGTNSSSNKKSSIYSCDIDIDDNCNPVLVVRDQYNNLISNKSVISKIKNTSQYKEAVNKLIADKRTEINNKTIEFVQIFKLSEPLYEYDEIRNELQLLLEKEASISFPKPKPELDIIKKLLEEEARKSINSILFWTNERNRVKYVEERINDRYSRAISDWENERDLYLSTKENEYNDEKRHLEKILAKDPEMIIHSVENVLSHITLPADFSANYELDGETLYIDLDLPEIEDMPKEVFSTTAKGKGSIKEKTEKELNGDYAICVCGISVFLASLMFNTSPEINFVAISGYTQRENKTLGRIEDQYVYSVIYDRIGFKELNYKTLDPIETIHRFPHKISVSRSFQLLTIDITKPLDEAIIADSVETFVKSPTRKVGASVPKVQTISSSIETTVELYDYYSREKRTVLIPKGHILADISNDDKTIFCLDSKTFINLDRYYDEHGKEVIIVKKTAWDKAVKEREQQRKRDEERDILCSLINEGIELEKNGDIDNAIISYEKCVSKKAEMRHPYDRLLVLYRKRNEKDNELRIAKTATSLFPSELKYKTRYENLVGIEKMATLPSSGHQYTPSIIHGDVFEQRILMLPEFDFYHNGTEGNYSKVSRTTLEPIWEIQRYFREKLESAELAESQKDFENAAAIYEMIISEKYWMPAPYDRLIKIYSKAKLHSDEKRVIMFGIDHFSQLREKRLAYVKSLAKKYSAEDFLNARLESGGKITYYNGVFELYNPFPIIEKWKERLEKKK